MHKRTPAAGSTEFAVAVSKTYYGLEGLHLQSLRKGAQTTEDIRIGVCDFAKKTHNSDPADTSFQMGAIIGFAVRTSCPTYVVKLLFGTDIGTVALAASNKRAFQLGLETGLGEVTDLPQLADSLLNSSNWRDLLSSIGKLGQGDVIAKVLGLGPAMTWLE